MSIEPTSTSRIFLIFPRLQHIESVAVAFALFVQWLSRTVLGPRRLCQLFVHNEDKRQIWRFSIVLPSGLGGAVTLKHVYQDSNGSPCGVVCCNDVAYGFLSLGSTLCENWNMEHPICDLSYPKTPRSAPQQVHPPATSIVLLFEERMSCGCLGPVL